MSLSLGALAPTPTKTDPAGPGHMNTTPDPIEELKDGAFVILMAFAGLLFLFLFLMLGFIAAVLAIIEWIR